MKLQGVTKTTETMNFVRRLIIFVWTLLTVLVTVWAQDDTVYYQPEQVHLSYPDDPTKMTVTWTTFSNTNSSVCEYGTQSLSRRTAGTWNKFVDGGIESRTMFIHRVTMDNLVPGQKYWYHCGSNLGWSDLFFFDAMMDSSNWSPRFAVFGDMGNINAQSMPYLQEETQRGDYDAIVHVGDFAYDMDSDNAKVGDEFMRQIEAVAAYVPYMVCPGNHEQMYNFSNYKNRFSMPGTPDNMFFSFNIGPVHFISLSTEFYFFTQYGFKQIANQYNWLKADLEEVNRPQNRARTPWIVVFGHRPMYCSNNDTDDCTMIDSVVRTGIPLLHLFGLEDLLYDYGVDLAFWAHEHSYERMYPVYNRQMFGVGAASYNNPNATVHVTTGSAGCDEDHDPFGGEMPAWTAFRSVDYGYTIMMVHNATHMTLQQISVEQARQVIDEFMIVQEDHGPFRKV